MTQALRDPARKRADFACLHDFVFLGNRMSDLTKQTNNKLILTPTRHLAQQIYKMVLALGARGYRQPSGRTAHDSWQARPRVRHVEQTPLVH